MPWYQRDAWRTQYIYLRSHRLTLIEISPSTKPALSRRTLSISAPRYSENSTLKIRGLWTTGSSTLNLGLRLQPLLHSLSPLCNILYCFPCLVSSLWSMYRFNCTSSHSYSRHVYPFASHLSISFLTTRIHAVFILITHPDLRSHPTIIILSHLARLLFCCGTNE